MMGARRRAAAPAAIGGVPGYSFHLQELWFSLTRLQWKTLALVPAHEGGTVLPLTKELAALGGVFRAAVTVHDAADLTLESVATLALSLQGSSSAWTSGGPHNLRIGAPVDARTLVALGPLLSNPLGIPVCLAVDGVLLVVESGVTTHSSARRTLELVGRERVIGSVLYPRRK
jgi:hypothetical protein